MNQQLPLLAKANLLSLSPTDPANTTAKKKNLTIYNKIEKNKSM